MEKGRKWHGVGWPGRMRSAPQGFGDHAQEAQTFSSRLDSESEVVVRLAEVQFTCRC